MGNSGRIPCWPREVQSPLELRRGAEDCSRATPGHIDSFRVVPRNSVILSNSDRDLGVAFKVQPGSQVSSRVEAKHSTLL